MAFIHILIMVMLQYTQFTNGQKFILCKDHYANSRIQEEWNTFYANYCYSYCGRHSWCRAVSVKRDPGNVTCTFHEGMFDVNCNSFPLMDKENYRLLLKKETYVPANDNGCLNGGTYDNDKCLCRSGFAGDNCERYVYICEEAKTTNVNLVPGEFTSVLTKSKRASQAFETACSFTGGILVLNRNTRESNLLYNRTFEVFKYPLGRGPNLWLGLQVMFEITLDYGSSSSLLVVCRNLDTGDVVANSHRFVILGDEDNLYTLYIGNSNDSSSVSMKTGANNPRYNFCTYDKPCYEGIPNNTMGGFWYYAGFEKYIPTNPTDSFLCKKNNNDFIAHMITLTMEP